MLSRRRRRPLSITNWPASHSRFASSRSGLFVCRPHKAGMPPRFAGPRCLLLDLPDEVLQHLWMQHLLACDLTGALRLCCISKALGKRAAAVQREAALRRLRWQPARGHAITADGRTVTRQGGLSDDSWATGSEVRPAEHRACSWTVRVERCRGNLGAMLLGVCATLDESSGASSSKPEQPLQVGWALHLQSGRLQRWGRYHGHALPCTKRHPPPPGWPDGAGTQVMRRPDDLFQRAVGALVEIIFDNTASTLAFRVNGGNVLHAISGFPPGAVVRPWVRLCSDGDRVSLRRAFF